MDKVNFKSSDSTNLVGLWHRPENLTQKAIVLAHGITVDKDEHGIFPEFAEVLAEHGFAVFRFDFRGHGESSGKSVDFTIGGELLDLGAAIDLVKNNYNQVGLLGASFGGSIASFYASQNKDTVKCLVLWNPVLNYDHTFLNPYLPWLKDSIGKMKDDLGSKGWTELGNSKLKVGKQLFEEMEKRAPYEALKEIDIPTLLIHGDHDQHVPYEDSKMYVNNLKQGKFITIARGEHGFQENKKHREEVQHQTLKFFQENL